MGFKMKQNFFNAMLVKILFQFFHAYFFDCEGTLFSK